MVSFVASASRVVEDLRMIVPSIRLENPYAPRKELEYELQLPEIEDFAFGAFETDFSTDSISLADNDIHQDEDRELKCVWDSAATFGPLSEEVKFFSWEKFDNDDHQEAPSAYVSDSGVRVMDAVVANHEINPADLAHPRTLKQGVVLQSLFYLGLGRSSKLFAFDRKKQSFTYTVERTRIQGCTSLLSHSIVRPFLTSGTLFQTLKKFILHVYNSPRSISARIALANSVSVVLSALESSLDLHSVKTLLQLQGLFKQVHEILAQLQEMVNITQRTKSNDALVVSLYQYLASHEQQNGHVRVICLEILSRVAKPWLEEVSNWIGLGEQRYERDHELPSFVHLMELPIENTPKAHVEEYMLNVKKMPLFITEEDGRIIFETGNAVRFLKSHHAQHPMITANRNLNNLPHLEWRFSWDEMEAIKQRASSFEEDLLTVISQADDQTQRDRTTQQEILAENVSEVDLDVFQDPDQYLLKSLETLDLRPTSNKFSPHDELIDLVVRNLSTPNLGNSSGEHSEFSPPLALTPSLSLMPIITAQARLVNAVTLRLFLRSHFLRHHFSLQRQYHLLGDGMFIATLSSALFSPNLATAERRKGSVRMGATMGLRLGSRTNWPPASSELRLALMSILSDCYYSSSLYNKATAQEKETIRVGGSQADLPGQLSFAVRTLAEEDVQKVMDPKSLYALDFLQLQYVPPAPLNLVITTVVMDKYDTIFKLLLRLLRMLHVTDHLPHSKLVSATRFRFEAIHFVKSISWYFFEVGIKAKWDAFSDFLDGTEFQLRTEDDDGELGTLVCKGLDSLRESHEGCLDRIMFSLFLRKRHAKVAALLEEIFSTVLRFAASLELNAELTDNDILTLYGDFKAKVDVFLEVCKGLSGKKDKARETRSGDEDDIDRFLVLMGMNCNE